MNSREKLLEELRIWEGEDFTKFLYEYIDVELDRVGELIVAAVRKKEYQQAHEHVGYRDALLILRAFGEEWVDANCE